MEFELRDFKLPYADVLANGFAFLKKCGVTAYVVGGACRDFLLGRSFDDLDLVVGCRGTLEAIKVVSDFADIVGGKRVVLDAERGTIRVIIQIKRSLNITGSAVENFEAHSSVVFPAGLEVALAMLGSQTSLQGGYEELGASSVVTTANRSPIDISFQSCLKTALAAVPVPFPCTNIGKYEHVTLSIDFCQMQGGSIEEDLHKRDFTINSIAWDLFKQQWLDPVGGIRDLRTGRLRTFSSSAYAEDPIRVLRALRMLCTLPLRPSIMLRGQVGSYVDLLLDAAPERIRDEWFGILRGELSSAWSFAQATGIIEEVLPEIKNFIPATREKVALLEAWQEDGFSFLGDWSILFCNHIEEVLVQKRARWQILKLAALLTDLEPCLLPPEQKENVEDGVQEEENQLPPILELSSSNVASLANRLRLSKRESRLLLQMVNGVPQAWNLAMQEDDGSGWYLLAAQAPRAIPEILVLTNLQLMVTMERYRKGQEGPAENQAKDAPLLQPVLCQWGLDKWTSVAEKYNRAMLHIMSDYFQDGSICRPLLPLTGKDLVTHFKLKPGPLLKELLSLLAQAVARGEVSTSQDAMTFVESNLAQTS